MHHILHYTLLLLQHSSECGYLSRFAKLSGFIAVTTTAKVKTFAMVAKASRKICHQRMSFNVTTNFFSGQFVIIHSYVLKFVVLKLYKDWFFRIFYMK